MPLKYLENFSLRRAIQSTIFKNYFFLSIYQVVNFAVPLIVVPFVIGKVGVANFGIGRFFLMHFPITSM